MKDVIFYIVLLVFSVLSVTSIVVAEENEENDYSKCLAEGRGWVECFGSDSPPSDHNALVSQYADIINGVGNEGVGLGTLSAPQGIRIELLNGQR